MGDRISILVIEDDPDLGLLLRDILSARPDVAASLARHPSAIPDDAAPDIIVTDAFGSAWYDSAVTTRQLEDLRRRFPGVPIILVTAHWQADAERALLPVDAVITKPFDVDTLAEVVLSFDATRSSLEPRPVTEA